MEANITKKSSAKLGVAENGLKSAIETGTGISCSKEPTVLELIRGIRLHFDTFVRRLLPEGTESDFLFKSERGLAHSYGRAKIKFNVNRADNMIIQSISILDQLDKDINTFAMRLRCAYSLTLLMHSRPLSESGTRGTFPSS